MSDHIDTADPVDDEFERLGRQAGAELRVQPPADGLGTVLSTARRRRATVAAVTVGVTVVIVVAGLLVANPRPQDEPEPVATVPPTPGTVISSTVPSDAEDAAPPDAIRTTVPGTWRTVADPSSLAPESPDAAVWTGSDVIVIGSQVIDDAGLLTPSAAAYEVAADRWRRLADPPVTVGRGARWTGSAVLVATTAGEVYAYDPVQDRWDPRARPDESMALPGADALVAVSSSGVLARSLTGWWWYDDSTDRWASVAAPPSGSEYSTLHTLDQHRIAAIEIDGATLTSAVFDVASRSWRSGPAVDDVPASARKGASTTCDANDGLLVCSAEGYGSLDGIVIDPLVGARGTFRLGDHSNTLVTTGLPWMTHAWKLLSPRTATWEDLPLVPDSDVDSFTAAAWTGSEILFFGGSNSATGDSPRAAAAYTPLSLPGP